MERLGGRLWEVMSYGSRMTARAKFFISQPRMEWYIYSKKYWKFSGIFTDKAISYSIRHAFTEMYFQKCP